MTREPSKPVNLGRHKRNCTICAHAQCEEIEREFINWKSPTAITAERIGIGSGHPLSSATPPGMRIRAERI